jgi:thiamine-phosphate pyrophosphorylase
LQKVNKVFLSSIFKKNKNYLGINKFRLLSNLTKKKVVALGGITKKNKKLLNILNIEYFAGISYFK